MPVEFRVLGPLEIRRDGSPVPLRASKPRTLLAVLLVNHGRVVSVDRLIDALWPESPPEKAQHALETHAYRLRTLLGDDLPLAARPPGYVLDVDPQSLDSVRFEQLLSEARASEPARGAARAADALALWRGDALADFTFDSFAQEEIARLEELRHEAEEERIEAELVLGHAGELIGELEALVQVQPPRERRYGQLMLALYRTGRQQDALDVFKAARDALAEYGLEPSQILRELERSILQQDPGLDACPAPRLIAPAERRQVSIVAVAPEISLELDPEEHERQRRRVVDAVTRVAAEFGAQQPEPLVLAFVQEDQAQRARAAAAAIHDALRAGVGIETGEALVGGGAVSGPVVESARQRAREGGPSKAAPPALERRTEGPFVGREDELARLRASRAALVVGPPGIGKSRLARELGRDERVVVGRCSSYGTERLSPLHEIAAAFDAPTALDGVRAPELPLTFRRLCEAAGPILVVFDDVHWGDELVLETIEHLVTRGDSAVRVLSLAREELLEEHPTFLAAAERITLTPLSDEDSRRLATELGTADDSIVQRAEGNPLFIEQLLAHATDGVGALPTSLRSLLTARLDRLTPAERTTIDSAAVIGREFDAELVAELLEARNAREPLVSLVRRGLLDRALPSEAFEERFRFRHALIRETTYLATTEADRARLHETTADVLSARDSSDEIVGFHLEQAAALRPRRDRHSARLAEDAGRHLGIAGIAAWKRADPRAAARLLSRSTALLPERDAQRLELLCELGVALTTIGESAEAETVLRQACELGDRRIELRAELERALITSLAGSQDAARLLELADAGRPVFEAVGDDRALGRALMLAGWVRGGAFGLRAEWESAAEQALVHYRRAGWPATTCIGHIAAALYLGPTPAAIAIARCTQLLESGLEDLAGEASVSAHLGGLLAMTGDFLGGATHLERARGLYTELGRRPALLATCAPIEAYVARLRGEPEEAADVYRRSCEELQQARSGFHLATQAADLADVLCELGHLKDAEKWCTTAEQHARADDREGQLSFRIPRSRLWARAGKMHEAEEVARAAIRLADSTDDLNRRAATRLALVEVLELDGRARDAEPELQAAADLYREKGNSAAVDRLGRRSTAAAVSSGSTT